MGINANKSSTTRFTSYFLSYFTFMIFNICIRWYFYTYILRIYFHVIQSYGMCSYDRHCMFTFVCPWDMIEDAEAWHYICVSYSQTSDVRYTLLGKKNCWSLRCSWSIACRRCSNYIFILDLTPGFNGLGKDKCKIRWESLKYWDLVQFMLDILRYCHKVHGSMKKWDSHWQCLNLDLFAYLYGEWQHSMDCMAVEEPLLGITCYVIHRMMDTFLQLPSNL